MPKFDLPDDEDDAPLFDPSDPLQFSLPDAEHTPGEDEDQKWIVYDCVDTPALPDDSHLSLSTQPRAYMIEAMSQQVVYEQRLECKRNLRKLFDLEMIDVPRLLKLQENLGDARETARPTGGR
jgi:hypothetical protein